MCTTLFYYTCVYTYSLLNSCGYWTLNKYYYYYYYYKIQKPEQYFADTDIKSEALRLAFPLILLLFLII